jgi:DNA helicase II / ATP-dependent DNA helicase PcrA
VRFHADLHVHSKYSRACSRDGDLEHLAWWAARKGLSVVGSGDFTHPAWSEELRAGLVPAEPGLYRLRPDLERDVLGRLPASCRQPVRFLLSTEISTIYKRDERTRKVHHLLYAPDFAAMGRITDALARVGNLASDGRPILGLDSRHLLEITLSAGDGCYLVPAHAWTPWFAVLGSQSGFDAVEDCYGDLAGHVFALETGLSSDPGMNWRVSSLDRYQLVSNSDAHSPPMLGREATTFDTSLDYFAILHSLRTGEGLAGTVEFFPEEGKYHLDGHRACDIRAEPADTRGLAGRCPVCGKPLTVGVLHRVEALADEPPGRRPAGRPGYRSLIQLPEIVGELLRVGASAKSVARQVTGLVERLGPELAILDSVALDEVGAVGSSLLVEALSRLRQGRVIRQAGYDGVYGVIRLFRPEEVERPGGTQVLFGVPAADRATERRGRPAAPPPDGRVIRRSRGGPDGAVSQPARPEHRSSGPDTLDPEQRAAMAGPGSALLVVAGPGTGKTRLLTNLVAHRITNQGVAPERCLAVTFTRRACAELRERLVRLLPGTGERVLVTTFAGLGLLLVREQAGRLGLGPEVRVLDDPGRGQLVAELVGGSSGLARRSAQRITEGKRARARLAAAGSLRSPVADDELLAAYDTVLAQRGLVDLDDLSALPVQLLAGDARIAAQYRERWQLVCIDEYQDTDDLQHELIHLIAGPGPHEGGQAGEGTGGPSGPREGGHAGEEAGPYVCAIGDPDQAIYGFRGADVRHFLRFTEDFPGARVAELSRNYRSTPTIVAAALQVVAPSTLAPGRTLEAVGATEDGPIVFHRARDEREEALFVAETIERLLGGGSFATLDRGAADGSDRPRLSFADFAVLYRAGSQAEAVAEALARRGFPCRVRSHDRLAGQKGVQAVLCALRQLAEDGNGLGVSPLVEAAVRQAAEDGADSADALAGAAELLAPLAADCGTDVERFLTEVALGAGIDAWDRRADLISLLTLHAAKGLEFPVVFVIGCDDGLLPLFRIGSRVGAPEADQVPRATTPVTGGSEMTDEDEERRLLFVGMTRASRRLVLTSARSRTRWGQVQSSVPSPFLAAIDPALLDQTSLSSSRHPAPRQLRLL